MDVQQRFTKLYASFCTEEGKLTTVHALLKRAATLWPTRIMVICDDHEITYGDLYKRAQLLGHTLQDKGVTKGERVILYYENSVEFFVGYFAVWCAGGIVAPLNVFLHERELAQIIKEAEPKVIIVSPTLKDKLSLIATENLPPLISVIDIVSTLPESIELVKTERFDEDDTVALLYTSGTTGFPKGVMLSSKNIITNALQGISSFETGRNERIFCPLPLFHSLPQNICLWSLLIVGATALIVPKIDRRSLLKGIAQKPTIIIAVPALYGLFCMLKTIDFGSVRYFVSGGDALSDKVRAFFALIYGRKIANGYGLTEASPFIAVDLEDYSKPTNTIGRPLQEISVEIRDEQGTPVPQGAIGTLWVMGNNIMQGYYKAQEATDEIIKNGWLNTGDLAYLTPDGKIVLAGRERDLISNKGLKIYPQEVENIILSHKDVLQVAVIGLIEGDEELPIAYIGTKIDETGYEALEESLRNLCLRNLAPYKVPRAFYFKRDLPITSTGKVNKKVLRDEHLEK